MVRMKRSYRTGGRRRSANGYTCGGKVLRNVCLILGFWKYPHHLVPLILILPRWF